MPRPSGTDLRLCDGATIGMSFGANAPGRRFERSGVIRCAGWAEKNPKIAKFQLGEP
jgi:pilus assembly protein Flp/PilA